MTKKICDLCGKEIETEYKTKWKLKYFRSDEWGSGWVKIDAHQSCIVAVAMAERYRKMLGVKE